MSRINALDRDNGFKFRTVRDVLFNVVIVFRHCAVRYEFMYDKFVGEYHGIVLDPHGGAAFRELNGTDVMCAVERHCACLFSPRDVTSFRDKGRREKD